VAYAAEQKRAGRLDSYVSKTFEGLRSFLKHNRVQFDEFPRLSPISGASLSRERVPTPQELGQVLERLSQRGRVIALFLAHSGLRPGVLGSYGGEAGLTLGDLPELELDPAIRMKETPFVIRVRADLSKTRRQYVTFGTEQLGKALVAYLTARVEAGEELGTSSPVLGPRSLRGAAAQSRASAGFGHGFMATKNVVKEIQDALHASVPEGVTWRPYVLRSYCSTRLLLAEGHGRISRDLREAILGHDGGIASRYNVGKRWGEELLTEARREYANASEFLETNAQGKTNVAAEFRRTLLDVAGLSEEEAADHMKDSNEEILAILRSKLLGREAAGSKRANGNGGGSQKPVSLVEAERLLGEGWTFVANFGPDRVLLQPP
jgi:integrase